MLQCFVRTEDLDKVYAATGKVLASANVKAMKLEAFKFYYARRVRRASQVSVRSQRRKYSSCKRHHCRREAIHGENRPHRCVHCTARRSATDGYYPYVSTFVPKMSGENLIRTSAPALLQKNTRQNAREPFEPFTFSPAGAAVYQLGRSARREETQRMDLKLEARC